jgi:hypothetical protein
MRTGNVCEIRQLENGVAVCVMDPAIRKKNQSGKGSWQDPEKEYAFPTPEKAMKWINDNWSTLVPGPDDDTPSGQYAAAFKEATR